MPDFFTLSISCLISSTIILGLGGKEHWQQHINETVTLLNKAPVTYLSTLQLYLDEISENEFHDKFNEKFLPQDDQGILLELSALISQLEPPKRIIFRSNHASNALPLAGNLPKDKDRLLAEINNAISVPGRLTPDYLRSL